MIINNWKVEIYLMNRATERKARKDRGLYQEHEFKSMVHGNKTRARLRQEWGKGLMCIRPPILNCPKNLSIFDELKYVV